MNTTGKRIISACLIVGALTLPSGLSLHGTTSLRDIVPMHTSNVSPLLKSEHVDYMAGYADGTIAPDRTVTRAEAATFIYRLLNDTESGTGRCSFTDLEEGRWYTEPVRTLCRLGLLTDSATFRPNAAITRAEFVGILAKLAPDIQLNETFSDVPEGTWVYDAVGTCAALGWVGGYKDGTFRPQNTLTRAEACAILNRVAGREGDKDSAQTLLTLGLYSDVSANHWAATDICEASVAHGEGIFFLKEKWQNVAYEQYTFAPGVYAVSGHLYAVGRDGKLLCNQRVGAYWANKNGILTQVTSAYKSTVPYISQLDEIEAEMGCEAISALMGLKAKGFALDESAESFLDALPKSESDPSEGFVGSPYYSDGRYSSIDPKPLADFCNLYTNGAAACEDFSGATIEALRQELLAGNFIVCYQTHRWQPLHYGDFVIDGETVQRVSNNHVRLICGYDPHKGYFVSDPYNDDRPGKPYQYWINANEFEALWNARQVGMVIR